MPLFHVLAADERRSVEVDVPAATATDAAVQAGALRDGAWTHLLVRRIGDDPESHGAVPHGDARPPE